MERQLMKWKKIFAYHISDNGLIFKVYKEHVTFGQLYILFGKLAD